MTKEFLIKQKAKELGFFSCGFAKAEFLESEAPKLDNYLNNNYQGQMSYLANHFDKRLDPTKLVEGSKTVISLSYNYFPEKTQVSKKYKISKYAYGDDYHKVIKLKLKELYGFIRDNFGDINGRFFVDSAPVLEKAWAKKSGLGWEGKNTLLIQKGAGSFFFLSQIILDLELDYDNEFESNHCGDCTKCIDACPTNAILPMGGVDGSKCISYLTIELKDNIPSSFKNKMNDWVFGCDICQDVCPWNRFSLFHNEPKFVNEKLLDFDNWEEITEEIFLEIFAKSPLKRTKFAGIKRNIDFLKR